MTNRIGGPIPPEGPRGSRASSEVDGKKFQKSVEKVTKADEAEFEKQGKRAFKKSMEEEDDESESTTLKKSPSPFATSYYLEEKAPPPPVGFADLVPEVPSSEPTTPSQMNLSSPQPNIDENLPESEQFWNGYDLPDQPPQPAHLQEKREVPFSQQQKKYPVKTPPLPISKTAPEKSLIAKKHPKGEFDYKHPLKTKKSRSDESLENMPLPIEKETKESFPSIKKKKNDLSHEESDREPRMYGTQAESHLREKKWDEKEDHKKKPIAATSSPVQPPNPLPPAAQTVAQIAQTAASPFLNPQTASLFLQMVGTIAYMADAKPGISLTEVTLSSPNFQNSIFYNSIITIEKYASAPDSFNIRLTGSPEAVNYFNNNVDNLASAFAIAYEDRRIKFRIGRLETALAPDRPTIRRKKEGGGKEDLNQR